MIFLVRADNCKHVRLAGILLLKCIFPVALIEKLLRVWQYFAEYYFMSIDTKAK